VIEQGLNSDIELGITDHQVEINLARSDNTENERVISIALRENAVSSITIGRVEPNKSLLCMPMPCEKKAAYIRNETIREMALDNTAMVCARYLQSRRGEKNTSIEAILHTVLASAFTAAMVWAVINRLYPTIATSGSALLGDICNILPNLGNSLRYHRTKQGCDDFLRTKHGDEFMKRLNQIKYSQKGLSELRDLLADYEVDHSALNRFVSSRGFHRHCLDCWDI